MSKVSFQPSFLSLGTTLTIYSGFPSQHFLNLDKADRMQLHAKTIFNTLNIITGTWIQYIWTITLYCLKFHSNLSISPEDTLTGYRVYLWQVVFTLSYSRHWVM